MYSQSDLPALLIAARQDSRITQSELARSSGVSQSMISMIESGEKTTTEATAKLLLANVPLRPSVALGFYRDLIRSEASHAGLSVKVFGSASKGTDSPTSDIDLLVSFTSGTDPYAPFVFADRVESITGFPVDVVYDASGIPAFASDDSLKSIKGQAVDL